MHACRSCPRVPLPLVIIPSPAEAERAGGGDAGFVCSALLRRRGHPGGVRPQAVPSARFCSVSFRSSVVASPPRRPGPPRPAPHVAHQPDPNAATATRGAVGSRSRSVAACPQYTTTANKARPKPTDGSRRRRRGRARGTGGISLWGHPRGTRELVGSIDIGTVLAGDADRAAGT